MIIECVKCNKKFDVNSALIPINGRTIQCGSCFYTWFYKPEAEVNNNVILENNINKNKKILKENDNKKELYENTHQVKYKVNKNIPKKVFDKPNKNELNKKKSFNFDFSKILSYFIVAIISFVALVIFLDTFKDPLENFFPDLELLLYNLFESIKDIILFVQDLLI